ncbi:MAG: YigZ family protein [Bifidobacteriaceae bacterium]|jgi:uncharacterized YigZ family protein|nr:YigZ family protein [Bifidobacteriaceae bacterium]
MASQTAGWAVLAAPAEATTVVDKSRFIAALIPCDSPEALAAAVAERRRLHYAARHHCSAAILGSDGRIQRSSDDGEPSGTAGVPMLSVLRHRRVTDLVAVVTRYFGGVLLGAGGLVRAYSGAVSAALDVAVLEHLEDRVEWTLAADFTKAGRLENTLRAWASRHQADLNVDFTAVGAEFTMLLKPADGPDFAALAASMGTPAIQGPTVQVRVAP